MFLFAFYPRTLCLILCYYLCSAEPPEVDVKPIPASAKPVAAAGQQPGKALVAPIGERGRSESVRSTDSGDYGFDTNPMRDGYLEFQD